MKNKTDDELNNTCKNLCELLLERGYKLKYYRLEN